MIDVQKVYDDWIRNKNDIHYKKRYEGNEEWFHASSSGMCMRKHYFQHVTGIKPEPFTDDTLRLFRLGDLVHGDIQEAVRDYADKNGAQVMMEKEIRIPEVNVRGFFDLLLVEDGAMIDIKTCNAWKWRNLFGRTPDPNAPVNYYLQLGTYGWWYEEDSGNKLDKLALLYYNKDTSKMREKIIPVSFIDEAKQYWYDVKDMFKKGNPPIELGTAPVYKWECNPKWCSFNKVCGGLIEKGDNDL
tara:strand:+ start:1202 stop:1930 length:729 start_codon:yes stop_codon:yes gene_type:complete